MSFDYARSRATAERLIANFGQSVTLRQQGADLGDDWAPNRAAPTDTTIVVVDLEEVNMRKEGTTAGQQERKMLISTSAGIVPKVEDKIQIGGDWHAIESLMPLAPGGTTILYEAELRD